jgi:ubiquitin carboxyl-terminal hydrolase 9/13
MNYSELSYISAGMVSMWYAPSCDASADCVGCSGPHHGHYVAIVKGPHSWLIFDDDKIEAIKENEIPRYFGDATSGSAYVLYYQAVDLDPVSLGIKVPAGPTVPDITITGSPAYATTTNGTPSLELPDPALPPGLGESPVTSPAAEPTPHPPILTAPSSPSLATLPLIASVTLPSRKKSLPSIRIPAPDSSNTPIATSGRTHGGLFNTFRSSSSGSKTRPSTSDGTVSIRSTAEDARPPVPPVPLQYVNGKDTKEHDKDKDKDKGGEKEREEERSSKEFDRRPSLWFKRRTAKPTKEEREKEKEKEKDKDKDKDKDKEKEKEKEKEK